MFALLLKGFAVGFWLLREEYQLHSALAAPERGPSNQFLSDPGVPGVRSMCPVPGPIDWTINLGKHHHKNISVHLGIARLGGGGV